MDDTCKNSSRGQVYEEIVTVALRPSSLKAIEVDSWRIILIPAGDSSL